MTVGAAVLCGIAALVLVLLFAPVSLRAAISGGGASLQLRYLFIRYTIVDDKPKKPKKPAKAKKTRKKKEKAAPEKKRSKSDTFNTVWLVLKSARRGSRYLCRHMVFQKVRILISAGSGDAHQTALLYTRISALVAGALDVVALLFTLRTPKKIAIAPDFTRADIQYDISFRIVTRPVYILGGGLHILLSFAFTLIKGRRIDAAGNKRPGRRKRPAKAA